MAQAVIWIPARVADTQPAALRPDAVAGNGDAETVLDQLYQAYAESHESDPSRISEGFKELECFLETLPLVDNNAVFNLCCRLCTAYEEKAFRHGLLYGAHLMQELFTKEDSQ